MPEEVIIHPSAHTADVRESPEETRREHAGDVDWVLSAQRGQLFADRTRGVGGEQVHHRV